MMLTVIITAVLSSLSQSLCASWVESHYQSEVLCEVELYNKTWLASFFRMIYTLFDCNSYQSSHFGFFSFTLWVFHVPWHLTTFFLCNNQTFILWGLYRERNLSRREFSIWIWSKYFNKLICRDFKVFMLEIKMMQSIAGPWKIVYTHK